VSLILSKEIMDIVVKLNEQTAGRDKIIRYVFIVPIPSKVTFDKETFRFFLLAGTSRALCLHITYT
jgi:hypothetical protein